VLHLFTHAATVTHQLHQKLQSPALLHSPLNMFCVQCLKHAMTIAAYIACCRVWDVRSGTCVNNMATEHPVSSFDVSAARQAQQHCSCHERDCCS
jgi:hypothetical protein